MSQQRAAEQTLCFGIIGHVLRLDDNVGTKRCVAYELKGTLRQIEEDVLDQD